ncbi:MAG TPA: HAD-IA family hydrolase [Anaeromyxobacter sp.]|nr:HAD-IA family hydrolase [Anaeromyxobacter sp.]
MSELRARLGPRQAFLFDLFHTLTGLDPPSAYPSTADVLGIDRVLWNRLLEESSPQRLCGHVRDPFRIVRALADQADPSIPDEVVRRAVEIRKARFREELRDIPPVNVAVLRRLRAEGLRLGLVSNADALEAAPFPGCPLDGCFDVVTFSCDAGCAKPERRIYERTLGALGVRPEEAVFVGDGGSEELRGAREVGLTTVLMTGVIRELWPERVAARRTWADFEIASLGELLSPRVPLPC